jgi:hypothetical protein
MTSDLDIYRAANLVIKRHGADAVIEAVRMVDRCVNWAISKGKLSGDEFEEMPSA